MQVQITVSRPVNEILILGNPNMRSPHNWIQRHQETRELESTDLNLKEFLDSIKAAAIQVMDSDLLNSDRHYIGGIITMEVLFHVY